MPPFPRRVWLALLLGSAIGLANAQPAAPGVTVTDPAGHVAPLSLQDLQALPTAEASLGADRRIAGPSLWAVLQRAGVIDPNFHHRINQTVVATGRDGYSATVAMAEIDPEFEHKPVLLAIDPDHASLRLAVPGDKRLGRDVRDVVSLAVR